MSDFFDQRTQRGNNRTDNMNIQHSQNFFDHLISIWDTQYKEIVD